MVYLLILYKWNEGWKSPNLVAFSYLQYYSLMLSLVRPANSIENVGFSSIERDRERDREREREREREIEREKLLPSPLTGLIYLLHIYCHMYVQYKYLNKQRSK